MNDSTLRRRVSPLIRTIKTRMNSRKLNQTLIHILFTQIVIFSSTIISVNTKWAIWKHLINHGNISPLNPYTDHIGYCLVSFFSLPYFISLNSFHGYHNCIELVSQCSPPIHDTSMYRS